MRKSWLTDYEREPEYMKLDEQYRRKLSFKLLIFPVICLLISVILIFGEIFPNSSLPSVTKARYLIESNKIAQNLINGNSEEIMKHILVYYDNDYPDYLVSNCINDIYDETCRCLDEAETSFSDDKTMAVMATIAYQNTGFYCEKVEDNNERKLVWKTSGIITVNKQDFITVFINFEDLNNYTVELQLIDPEQGELSDSEYLELLTQYRSGKIYKSWNKAIKQIRWFKNILLNVNANTQFVTKLLNSKNKTVENISTYFTSYFSDIKNDASYPIRMSKSLLKLSEEYTVESITLSNIDYDSFTKKIISKLSITIKDKNNKIGDIDCLCLNTSDGYIVVPNSVKLTGEKLFDDNEATEFVNKMNNRFAEYKEI